MSPGYLGHTLGLFLLGGFFEDVSCFCKESQTRLRDLSSGSAEGFNAEFSKNCL
jgi:hypothetical protein